VSIFRAQVVVWGRTLLDVKVGTESPPAPAADEAEPEARDSADPGPVTERRAAPMIGFAAPPRPGSRRTGMNDLPVIR
jgi:hypothetical protein